MERLFIIMLSIYSIFSYGQSNCDSIIMNKVLDSYCDFFYLNGGPKDYEYQFLVKIKASDKQTDISVTTVLFLNEINNEIEFYYKYHGSYFFLIKQNSDIQSNSPYFQNFGSKRKDSIEQISKRVLRDDYNSGIIYFPIITVYHIKKSNKLCKIHYVSYLPSNNCPIEYQIDRISWHAEKNYYPDQKKRNNKWMDQIGKRRKMSFRIKQCSL